MKSRLVARCGKGMTFDMGSAGCIKFVFVRRASPNFTAVSLTIGGRRGGLGRAAALATPRVGCSSAGAPRGTDLAHLHAAAPATIRRRQLARVLDALRARGAALPQS